MIPVRKEVRKAVDAYLEASFRKPSDMGPLFLSEDRAIGSRDDWRLTTKSATRIVKLVAEQADIRKRITPHALRHTFASGTFMHCRNAVFVMKLLGHASIATTMRYINHLVDSDLRNATPAFLVGAKGPRVSPSIKHSQAA